MNYRTKEIGCRTRYKIQAMIHSLERFEHHLNNIDEKELKLVSNMIDNATNFDHPQFFDISEMKQALKKSINQWW